jgi:hypothetical protein
MAVKGGMLADEWFLLLGTAYTLYPVCRTPE